MKVSQSSDQWNAAQTASAPAASQRANEAAHGATAANANANARQSARSASVAVTVSSQARSLERASVQNDAEVDSQKVEAARAAIRDGTFSVNPEAIADKLLANAQEMLQRTTR